MQVPGQFAKAPVQNSSGTRTVMLDIREDSPGTGNIIPGTVRQLGNRIMINDHPWNYWKLRHAVQM
jgi:hypothetical protein